MRSYFYYEDYRLFILILLICDVTDESKLLQLKSRKNLEKISKISRKNLEKILKKFKKEGALYIIKITSFIQIVYIIICKHLLILCFLYYVKKLYKIKVKNTIKRNNNKLLKAGVSKTKILV